MTTLDPLKSLLVERMNDRYDVKTRLIARWAV